METLKVCRSHIIMSIISYKFHFYGRLIYMAASDQRTTTALNKHTFGKDFVEHSAH